MITGVGTQSLGSALELVGAAVPFPSPSLHRCAPIAWCPAELNVDIRLMFPTAVALVIRWRVSKSFARPGCYGVAHQQQHLIAECCITPAMKKI